MKCLTQLVSLSDCSKFVKQRVTLLKDPLGNTHIFGQIDPSAMLHNDFIQLIEQIKQARLYLKIEGQAVTFQGK